MKHKSLFAALAAVIMIAAAFTGVLPFTGNNGSDAVAASSDNVVKDVSVVLYTKDTKDLSGLVYFGIDDLTKVSNQFEKVGTDASANWYNKVTGKMVRYGDLPASYANKIDFLNVPMIQITYLYSQSNLNDLTIEVSAMAGTGSVNITGPNSDGKVLKATKGVADVNKIEGGATIYTQKMDVAKYDSLELDPNMSVGDISINMTAWQGVSEYKSSNKINLGPAVTVSGAIKSANNIGIPGVTVTFTVDTVVKTITTVDGTYSLNVAKGSVVSVAIAKTGYNFDNSSYSFGTVDKSVSKEFKSVQSLAIVDAKTANSGNPLLLNGLTALWYYQYKDAAGKYQISTNLPTGITAGTQGSVEYFNGKAFFSYTVPTGTLDPIVKGTEYAHVLLVSGIGTVNGGYTFDIAGTFTDDKTMSQQLSVKKGSADAGNGTAIVFSKENTLKVDMKTSNSNVAEGNITVQWYYQYKDTTTGKYVIGTGVPSGINAGTQGTVTYLDGIAYVSYAVPTGTLNPTTGTEYAHAFVVTATGQGSYTYEPAVVPDSGDGTKTLASQISNKNATKDGTNGSATVVSLVKTWKVSGTVSGASNVEITYTGGIGTGKVTTDAKGAYTFYVLDKSVVTVSVPAGYTPGTYSLGTVESDKTANFAKNAVAPTEKTVKYQVSGVMHGDVIKFTYTVDGKSFTADIAATGGSATKAGVATLTITAKIGSVIVVTAVAISNDQDVKDGVVSYDKIEFNGYAAVAKYTANIPVVTAKDVAKSAPDAKDIKISGAMSAKVNYKIVTCVDPTSKLPTKDSQTFTGTVITDGSGIGKFVMNGLSYDSLMSDKDATVVIFSIGNTQLSHEAGVSPDHAIGPCIGVQVISKTIASVTVDGKVIEKRIGEKITLKAEKEIYSGTAVGDKIVKQTFKGWYVDGKLYSTDNNTEFTVSGDATIVAVYDESLVNVKGDVAVNMNIVILAIVAIVIAALLVAAVILVNNKKSQQ